MQEAASTERVQVIDRSVDLLEALQAGPRSLTEICRETGLSKATAFRLLAGLGLRGVVMKAPLDSTYTLGPALLRLAQGALASVGSLAGPARGALRELAAKTEETVALHVRSGLERVYVDEIPSPQSIRYTSLVGSTAPLHLGSSGIVLLAFMDAEQRLRTVSLLEMSLKGFSRRMVETKVKAAQREGWSVDMGARLAGASAISVPVTSRRLLLAMTVIGPSSRLPAATLETFLPAMRRTAARLAETLDAHGQHER